MGGAEDMVVLVTGGTGLVGRGVEYITQQEPVHGERWVFVGSADADLLSPESTRALFEHVKPTHVLHLAAQVGGLFANMVRACAVQSASWWCRGSGWQQGGSCDTRPQPLVLAGPCDSSKHTHSPRTCCLLP